MHFRRLSNTKVVAYLQILFLTIFSLLLCLILLQLVSRQKSCNWIDNLLSLVTLRSTFFLPFEAINSKLGKHLLKLTYCRLIIGFNFIPKAKEKMLLHRNHLDQANRPAHHQLRPHCTVPVIFCFAQIAFNSKGYTNETKEIKLRQSNLRSHICHKNINTRKKQTSIEM